MKKIFVLLYFCFSLFVTFGQGAGIRYVNGIPTAATYTPNLLKKEAVRCYSLTSKKFYYWDDIQHEWFEELLNSQPVSFSDGGGVKHYLNGTHFFSLGDDWENYMPLVTDGQLVPDAKRRWIWGWNQGSNTYHGFGYMQMGADAESWVFGGPNTTEVSASVKYNTFDGDENTPTTTGVHYWNPYSDVYYTDRSILQYQNITTGGNVFLGVDTDEHGNPNKTVLIRQDDNQFQVRDDNYIRANKYDNTRDDGSPESIAWFDRDGVIRRSPIGSITTGINSLNNGVNYAIPYYLNNNLESNDRYIRKIDTTFLKGRSSIIYSSDNLTTLAAALKTGDGIRNIQGNENQSPFTFTNFANEGDGDWLNSANIDLAGFNLTQIDGGGDAAPSLRFYSARTQVNSLPVLTQKGDKLLDIVAYKHKGTNQNYPIKDNSAGFTLISAKVDSTYASGNLSSSIEFMTEENKGTSSGISPVRMKIKGNGNIGIGTITPTAKLEVAGQIKVTGGTPGVGKVLTSDASGLATWQTPSGSTNTDNQRLTKPTAGTIKLTQLGSASDYIFIDSSATSKWDFYNVSTQGYTTLKNQPGTTDNWVGIGVVPPTSKLDVGGKTTTQAIKVTTGAAANSVLMGDANGDASWSNTYFQQGKIVGVLTPLIQVTYSGGSPNYTVGGTTGTWTKIGNIVTVHISFDQTVSSGLTGGSVTITNFGTAGMPVPPSSPIVGGTVGIKSTSNTVHGAGNFSGNLGVIYGNFTHDSTGPGTAGELKFGLSFSYSTN